MAKKRPENGGKAPYFKPSEAQKISLLKRMVELRHYLFGRLSPGQFYHKCESWNQILEFAKKDLGMNYPTMKNLKAALRLWKSAAYKKYDHDRYEHWFTFGFYLGLTYSLTNFYRKTGNSPAARFTEVDNLVLDLYGRDRKDLTMIKIGDTEEGRDQDQDNIDAAMVGYKLGPKLLTSVKDDRLQFTIREMEEDEMFEAENEDENQEIEKYFSGAASLPRTGQMRLPVASIKAVESLPSNSNSSPKVEEIPIPGTSKEAERERGKSEQLASRGKRKVSRIVQQLYLPVASTKAAESLPSNSNTSPEVEEIPIPRTSKEAERERGKSEELAPGG